MTDEGNVIHGPDGLEDIEWNEERSCRSSVDQPVTSLSVSVFLYIYFFLPNWFVTVSAQGVSLWDYGRWALTSEEESSR